MAGIIGSQSTQVADKSNCKNNPFHEAKKYATEACSRGVATLETLEEQKEQLDHIEDTLEAHEFTIEKSLKVLRSMTWSGMLYNTFSTDRRPSGGCEANSGNVPSNNCSTLIASKISQSDSTPSKSNELFQPSSIFHEDNDDMIEIEQSVNNLHDISLAMQQQLEYQKEAMDRINMKTDEVFDSTLSATLKSSRLIQRYDVEKGLCVGKYQFLTDWGEYLCVDDHHYLVLSESPSISSVFNIYQRQENLLGIQNYKTTKFLGTTMLGNIKVSGDYWGKMEDCFVDLSGLPSGILVLSRNWGGGGWIKRGLLGQSLSDSTSDISDKIDILIVRAVKKSDTKYLES